MNTKYSIEIDNVELQKYFGKLINRIYKILPMKEEKCLTLESYINNLSLELLGGKELISYNPLITELLFNLESLNIVFDISEFRTQIFKCIKICETINKELGGDECSV